MVARPSKSTCSRRSLLATLAAGPQPGRPRITARRTADEASAGTSLPGHSANAGARAAECRNGWRARLRAEGTDRGRASANRWCIAASHRPRAREGAKPRSAVASFERCCPCPLDRGWRQRGKPGDIKHRPRSNKYQPLVRFGVVSAARSDACQIVVYYCCVVPKLLPKPVVDTPQGPRPKRRRPRSE